MIFRERRLSCLQPPAEVALETRNTVSELQPSAHGAQIVEGKNLNRMTKQDIGNWVKGL